MEGFWSNLTSPFAQPARPGIRGPGKCAARRQCIGGGSRGEVRSPASDGALAWMSAAGQPQGPLVGRGALESQLLDLSGESADLAIWDQSFLLPNTFHNAYSFYTAQIGGRAHLFLINKGGTRLRKDAVVTQVAQLKCVFGGEIVLVAPGIDRPLGHFLTSRGIGWIVSGEEGCLPEVTSGNTLLRRAGAGSRMQPRLSPNAQLVLFHHVLSSNVFPLSAEQLSGPLQTTSMALGRALVELTKAGLAEAVRRSRSMYIKMGADYAFLLRLSLPLLMSPVCSVHAVLTSPAIQSLPRSGTAALFGEADGHCSAPFIYALHSLEKVDFFRRHNIVEVADAEAEAFIECWQYDPRRLTCDDTVDRLSLLAQFWNHPDPEIAAAANDVVGYYARTRIALSNVAGVGVEARVPMTAPVTSIAPKLV